MATSENTLLQEDTYDKLPPANTPDGIYTLIGEHPSTPDNTSQAPALPPQRNASGYSSVHKPKKKKEHPSRSKTFSGRKTPPTVHAGEPRAKSTAPSPPSHLTKSDVFVDENYSDVNITLKELVDKYYERFPVLIRVTQGVCGRDERVTLSSLDCFKVHFLKHVDVINITSSSGDPYSVPQNSVLEFGLVYKTDSTASNGMEGVQFSKVSEILASQPYPKLVCTEEAWSSADGKVTLGASEVLAVLKSKKKKLLRKSSLVVYSFASKVEKVIPEDCVARFTTKPSSVRLHIPDIMEHVPDAFPCEAYIFVADNCKPESELPEALLTNAVRIKGSGKESSLVAAPATSGTTAAAVTEGSSFVEIPLDLKNVTLSVIATKSVVETEQLYDDTRHIIAKFNPSMLRSQPQENESSNTQQVLYSSLRYGYETIGVNIDIPPTIKSSFSNHQAVHRSRTPSPPPPPPPHTPPPVPSRVIGATTDSLISTPTKQGESFHFPNVRDVISSKASDASSLGGSPMKPLQRPPISSDTSPSSCACLSTVNPRPPLPLPGTEPVENGKYCFSHEAGDASDRDSIGLTKSASEASWHNENVCAKVNELQQTSKALEGRVCAVESTCANSSEVARLQSVVQSLVQRVEVIEKLLHSQETEHVNGFCLPVPPSPPSPSSIDQNLHYLRSLDCLKVSLTIAVYIFNYPNYHIQREVHVTACTRTGTHTGTCTHVRVPVPVLYVYLHTRVQVHVHVYNINVHVSNLTAFEISTTAYCYCINTKSL